MACLRNSHDTYGDMKQKANPPSMKLEELKDKVHSVFL
jgi:hypothetical protein